MPKNIKRYSKEAKKRLVNGFWADIKEFRDSKQQIAAAEGKNALPDIIHHREDIRNQIYNQNYQQEELFYNKVVQLLTSGEVVSDPILRLADANLLKTLNAEEKHSYLVKVSDQYKKCVDRYKRNKQG